jgi:polysaccharide export outer membrane protein
MALNHSLQRLTLFAGRPPGGDHMPAVMFVMASAMVLLSAAWTPSAAAQTTEYVLGPQDIITITVFDHANLSGKFNIEADGSFTFPLIGRVKAAGLTPRAIESEVSKRLRNGYLQDPQLSVTIDQYRSQRIFIIGAVGQPGTFVLSGNTTLIEALARAGSTTNESVGEVIVVRAQPGTVAGPLLPEQATDAQVVRVDLKELEGGTMSQNITLQDGDTVVVPRGEKVFLLGEVRSPGSYSIRQGTTLLQLLALGGGVTERGATGRTKVVRTVAGKRKELKLNLDDAVQAGDTIVVPEKYF